VSAFKVGDRVRIVSLRGYGQSKVQGLVVGNTGTVMTVYSCCYGIRTDDADSERDATSSDGEGWAFFDNDLELLDGAALRAMGETP
jgi:hypothetical protein